MRKDVRMGFAVGGVLLAVLVVAILFFHHNKNADRAVAFDSGGKPAIVPGSDQPAPDPALAATDNGQSTTAAPAVPLAGAAPVSGTPAESTAPAGNAGTQKGGSQWDVLFNSTAEDPIKAQLMSETLGKPKSKSRKHKPDAASVMDSSDSHESSAIPAVANTPLNTNSTPAPQTVSPAHFASASRLSSSSSKESARTHVVAQGETFVSIARAVYGDGRYYQNLIDANPNIDPDKLKPGMTIQLPPDAQVKEPRSKSPKSSGSNSASDGKTYTVQNGDSLYKIAKKLYGSGQKSDDLYEANKQLIGPDSTRLKVGMVLTLPEAPAQR